MKKNAVLLGLIFLVISGCGAATIKEPALFSYDDPAGKICRICPQPEPFATIRVVIQKGESLAGKMGFNEALQAARDLNLPVKENNVVIVSPGFCLMKENPGTPWKRCN